MHIIITKENREYFMDKMKAKSLNVVDQTTHTLTVKLSRNRFNGLFQRLVQAGENPYALMAW